MYVYFIQQHNGGPVKIGKAERPDRRLVSLQAASPNILRIRAVCLGGHSGERRFHEHFHASRLHGEWFSPTPELEAVMARLPSWESVKNGAFCPEVMHEERAILIQLYKLGYTYEDIAECIGLTKQRVQQIHKAATNNRLKTRRGADGSRIFERPKDRPAEPCQDAYDRLRAEIASIEFSLPEA